MADHFAPNHKLCYRCQGSGRERGVFYGKDPGDCIDCGGKGVVFKGTPPSPAGVQACEGCKPRPLCRDCADEDGTCPRDGLPCDPALRHTCGKYAAGVAPCDGGEQG